VNIVSMNLLQRQQQLNAVLAKADLKTEIRRRPKNFTTEEEIKVIQAKQYLTLNEKTILLNISPLTLRRWTL
jgi:hypothetical protein